MSEHIKVERRYWTTRVVREYLGLCAQTLISRRASGLPHTIIPGNRYPIFIYEPRRVKAYAKAHKMDVNLAEAEALHEELTREWAA
jgi:hypothetical protein